MNLTMKYEDGNAQQIEAESLISVPVRQDARFEFSEFELSPESIAVGDEANVMTNLYNLGRTRLYNVKAVFEARRLKQKKYLWVTWSLEHRQPLMRCWRENEPRRSGKSNHEADV